MCVCVTQVARYVWNKADFDAVNPETTDYLMGESTVSSPHSHRHLCHLVSIMEDLVVSLTVKLRCEHNMSRVCPGTPPWAGETFSRCFLVFAVVILAVYSSWSWPLFCSEGFFLCVGCMCTRVLFSRINHWSLSCQESPTLLQIYFFWLNLPCRSATVDFLFPKKNNVKNQLAVV